MIVSKAILMGRNWTSPSAHAAVHANFDAGRSRVGGARFWIFPHGGGCEFLLLSMIALLRNHQKRYFRPEFGYSSCTARDPGAPLSETRPTYTTFALVNRLGAAGVRAPRAW